jgi:small subunit ribosomal protein S8
MVTDTIADLLTRIRNAQMVGHRLVKAPVSKASESVLKILQSEGFIESYETKQDDDSSFKHFQIWLKYYESGEPVISLARRVSKSGRRVYSGSDKLPKVNGGLGISIVSTSQGVMSDREARRRKIGGEVMALVG